MRGIESIDIISFNIVQQKITIQNLAVSYADDHLAITISNKVYGPQAAINIATVLRIKNMFTAHLFF